MPAAARKLEARPMCAVCRRPVDSLTESEHFGRQRFTARCHGQVTSIDVPEGATVQDFGVVFAEPLYLVCAPAPEGWTRP